MEISTTLFYGRLEREGVVKTKESRLDTLGEINLILKECASLEDAKIKINRLYRQAMTDYSETLDSHIKYLEKSDELHKKKSELQAEIKSLNKQEEIALGVKIM